MQQPTEQVQSAWWPDYYGKVTVEIWMNQCIIQEIYVQQMYNVYCDSE